MSLLRSEWTKLRSVRGTWTIAVGTIVATVGVSLLGVTSQLATWQAGLPDSWDPTATSLKGLLVGQLLIGMLGASAITSEYGTGSITTSLSAVPQRQRLLAAKMVVAFALALATAAVTVAGAFLPSQAFIRGAGLPAADVTNPDVLRALLGATLYLGLIALVGLALGTITRSSSGALGILVALTIVAPALTPALPGAVGAAIAKYWPSTAGQAAYTVVATQTSLLPWLGLGVLALFTAYLGVASQLAFKLRDV